MITLAIAQRLPNITIQKLRNHPHSIVQDTNDKKYGFISMSFLVWLKLKTFGTTDKRDIS